MVIVLINVWVKTPCLFQGDRLSSGQLKANRHCILQLLTRSYSKYSALFWKCCSKKNLKKKKNIFKGLFSKVLINSELAFIMCNKKKNHADLSVWRLTNLKANVSLLGPDLENNYWIDTAKKMKKWLYSICGKSSLYFMIRRWKISFWSRCRWRQG